MGWGWTHEMITKQVTVTTKGWLQKGHNCTTILLVSQKNQKKTGNVICWRTALCSCTKLKALHPQPSPDMSSYKRYVFLTHDPPDLATFSLFSLTHPYTGGTVMSSRSHWNRARFLLSRLTQGVPVFCRLLPLAPQHAAVFAPPPPHSKHCMHAYNRGVRQQTQNTTLVFEAQRWEKHVATPNFYFPSQIDLRGQSSQLHSFINAAPHLCWACGSLRWWHCTDSAPKVSIKLCFRPSSNTSNINFLLQCQGYYDSFYILLLSS